MLVIARKEGQRFALEFGGVVAVVTVLAVDGSKVRVGIDAPPEVRVMREEIAAGAAVLAALDK